MSKLKTAKGVFRLFLTAYFISMALSLLFSNPAPSSSAPRSWAGSVCS